MTRRIAALALLMAATASARQPDGTLDVIVTPNSGQPAVVTPGGVVEAVLTQEAALQLVGEGRTLAVASESRTLPGGRFAVRGTLPADTPPGSYDLQATPDSGRSDVSSRAVFVRAAFDEYYLLAHIADTRVGAGEDAGASLDMFRQTIDALNDGPASAVLISGDLTADGSAEAFRAFLGVLDTCRIPTFVTPGSRDQSQGIYSRFFGPVPYAASFGEDAFLGFDTEASPLGPQDARLQVLRREVKPARWAIAFGHRYRAGMPMRTQLVLFVDDPVDHALFGVSAGNPPPSAEFSPWGTTTVSLTRSAAKGFIKLLGVSLRGVQVREPAPEAPSPDIGQTTGE